MSTNESEQMLAADLMSSFLGGLPLLMVLAGRNPTIVPREDTLEIFAAFEASYGSLAELQAAGRFHRGESLLSAETGERVARLGTLLRLAPDSAEAERAASEIRSLAEQCLGALAPDMLAAG